MQPNETKDYAIFKTLKGNRKINQKHVGDLKKAFERKNMLNVRPIIVNSKMEVIDGQHRLQAAKELGLPVFFFISPEADFEDAAMLNANADNWDLSEYMQMYVEQKHDQYLKLNDFISRHDISLDKALVLLKTKYRSPEFYRSFKEGLFSFSCDEEHLNLVVVNIKKTISYIKSKTVESTGYLNKKMFWWALYKFFNMDEVDFDEFFKKLEINVNHLRLMPRHADYLNAFFYIYNYKRRNKISL